MFPSRCEFPLGGELDTITENCRETILEVFSRDRTHTDIVNTEYFRNVILSKLLTSSPIRINFEDLLDEGKINISYLYAIKLEELTESQLVIIIILLLNYLWLL